MSTVLLLTAESLPHEDLDTQLLAGALTELGIGSSTVPWTLVTDRTDADLAVIRTTWDYTSRREEFLGFLESLPMPVVNPSAVARWNSHKGYLAELGAAGVPVVPVTMVAQGGRALIPAVGADRIIVKPAISAGARGVGLFASDDPAAAEHLAALIEVGDALVQPFEASVAEGERSLLYLGGTFSHAIRKIPADGDFRVQTRYGGQNLPHRAGPAELAVRQGRPGGHHRIAAGDGTGIDRAGAVPADGAGIRRVARRRDRGAALTGRRGCPGNSRCH